MGFGSGSVGTVGSISGKGVMEDRCRRRLMVFLGRGCWTMNLLFWSIGSFGIRSSISQRIAGKDDLSVIPKINTDHHRSLCSIVSPSILVY